MRSLKRVLLFQSRLSSSSSYSGGRKAVGLHPALGGSSTWSISELFLTTPAHVSTTSEAAVAHLAKLAGLTISPDQLPRFASEMDSLVRMVGTVQAADVGNIEPFVSFAREGKNAEGSWIREEEEDGNGTNATTATTDTSREERGKQLLRHAAKLDRNYFVVKKTVAGSEESS